MSEVSWSLEVNKEMKPSHMGAMSAKIDMVDSRSSQKKNDPKYPLTPIEERVSSRVKQLIATILSCMKTSSLAFSKNSILMSSATSTYTAIRNRID